MKTMRVLVLACMMVGAFALNCMTGSEAKPDVGGAGGTVASAACTDGKDQCGYSTTIMAPTGMCSVTVEKATKEACDTAGGDWTELTAETTVISGECVTGMQLGCMTQETAGVMSTTGCFCDTDDCTTSDAEPVDYEEAAMVKVCEATCGISQPGPLYPMTHPVTQEVLQDADACNSSCIENKGWANATGPTAVDSGAGTVSGTGTGEVSGTGTGDVTTPAPEVSFDVTMDDAAKEAVNTISVGLVGDDGKVDKTVVAELTESEIDALVATGNFTKEELQAMKTAATTPETPKVVSSAATLATGAAALIVAAFL